MYETFENLPESKRKHILQVCIEEFAKNGYVNTSTNTIVKRLGISKGLLFLYFKSKRNLFTYIVNYLMEDLIDYYVKHYLISDQIEFLDIFDRMSDFYNMLMQDNPYVVMFLMEAILNTPAELREEIQYKHDLAHERIINKMKTSNLRENVSIRLAMDMMHIASYHVGQIMLEDYDGEIDFFRKKSDKYLKLLDQYIDIIKYGIYKR